MGTQNQKTNDSTALKNALKITRFVFAIIGILSFAITIVTLIGKMPDLINFLNLKVTFNDNTQFLTTLISSIVGVLLLFFAFSPAIDRFFNVIERKEIKVTGDESKSGVSLDFLFFISIAIVLTIIAVLLGVGYLVVEVELPLIGKHTKTFILSSISILAVVSTAVAFNDTLRASLKEMKRVSWPKAKQMSEYSAQVFAFIIFFALLFFAFDFVIGFGFDRLTNLFS